MLRRADCPVLLVPPTADTRSFAAGRIVAAYDFSAPASGALATAVELAGTLGLPLDLLHVVEVTYVSSPYGPVTAPVDYEALRRRAARLLSAVAPLVIGSLADTRGFGAAFVLTGAAYLVAAVMWLGLPETKGRQLA